jgi:hypothetical protein
MSVELKEQPARQKRVERLREQARQRGGNVPVHDEAIIARWFHFSALKFKPLSREVLHYVQIHRGSGGQSSW